MGEHGHGLILRHIRTRYQLSQRIVLEPITAAAGLVLRSHAGSLRLAVAKSPVSRT